MAQYKTGTVTVTNGSTTVIGANTGWVGEVDVGDLFMASGDNVTYQVAAVVSNTQLTLNASYAGTTRSTTYAVTRDFTSLLSLPYLQPGDIEIASVWKRAMDIIDTQVGNPGATAYDLVQDLTPQLGGDLDVNGKNIVSVSNGNIRIVPNGTGRIYLNTAAWPTTNGANQQVLYTDGAGNLSWATPPGATGGEANTVSNLGTGHGIYSTKVGVDLKLKSLVAGTNITITNDANHITINAAASSGVTSITAGTGLTGGTISTTGTIALATTGVTAGTYLGADVTVDAYGRVTAVVANTAVAKTNVNQAWTVQQNYQAQVTSGTGTTAWDLNNAVRIHTCTGNITLSNPTNMKAGGFYTIIVKQDATGGRTISWGSNYKFPDNEAPVLSTSANKVDIFHFVCDGTYMYGVGAQNYL